MNSENNRFLLLGALTCLLLFSGLGGYDLSAPDEPHYALVAREMLENNHWLQPHRNDTAYPDKPPLFFWSIAAVSALTGGEVTALSARLPSVLAAVWVLYLLWGFAKERESDKTLALLTVLAALGCFRFFFQARMAQIDMLLTALTTTACVLGYRLVTDQVSQRARTQVAMGLLLGLGILAKGPVGYLIPVGALLLFTGFCGRPAWRFFPRKALLWGLVPPLLWIGALLVEVSLSGEWDYLNNLLFKQTVVRYLNPWHHHKPFYYFATVLFYDFQPWIWLLLGAIPFRKAAREQLDPRQKFAWAMVVFTLVFFSLSTGKRNLYIMPLYPFAVFLVAAQIRALLAERSTRPVWGLILPAATVFVVGIALTLVALGFFDDKIPAWVETAAPYLAIGLAGGGLMAAGGYGIWSAARHRVKPAFAAILVAMSLLNVLYYQVALPWVNPFRSARRFTEEATQYITSHDPSPTVGMVLYRSAYRFYGKYPLVEICDTDNDPPGKPTLPDFWAKHPDSWLIIRRDQLERYQSISPFPATIHLSRFVGRGEEFLLVTRSDQATGKTSP